MGKLRLDVVGSRASPWARPRLTTDTNIPTKPTPDIKPRISAHHKIHIAIHITHHLKLGSNHRRNNLLHKYMFELNKVSSHTFSECILLKENIIKMHFKSTAPCSYLVKSQIYLYFILMLYYTPKSFITECDMRNFLLYNLHYYRYLEMHWNI